MKFQLSDLKNSPVAGINAHLFDVPKKKRSKYGSEPVEIDGHKFPSKKEAGRYLILRQNKTLGLLKDFRLQVPYELNSGGTYSYRYIADFVYIDTLTGLEIVEDAKGYRTREYRKKFKLMQKVHGITIKEV